MVSCGIKMEIQWENLHQLFIDFKVTCDSAKKDILCIPIECGKPVELVWLIKTCLNETYSVKSI
ncbi:hypothetical protein L798_12352 [Zootermopsis nevadensis]|uniref:Uncharacterized protein n=1 Tax=Zootermopsis nevadensis TaxID=136037 RepID=A0A067R611_ZOONE|nr:hypothetical protein L798_12352 [Zootermopsis nevadensis]